VPAVPFIRAISGTSPTSQLNVTFLQKCAIEPKFADRSRGQRTAAYNSRSVGICTMFAGSMPVSRFSPNNLPGRHQRKAETAQTDQAWATYRVAMDGIEETKAGNRPVSEFRATFLRHRALRTMCSETRGTKGRAWACMRAVLRLLRSLGSGTRLPLVAELATHGSTLALGGKAWARRAAPSTSLRGRTSTRVGVAA
jgi:hypothetical protein